MHEDQLQEGAPLPWCLIIGMAREAAQADTLIEKLRFELRLKRARFGASSEKLGERVEQLDFAIEAPEDDLIAAMADRWLAGFDAEVARHVPPDGTASDRARGYVTASARIDDVTQTKMAGMLVSLLQSPGHLKQARRWYADWLKRLEPGSEAERRARAVFFAAEGAFFLRSLGLVEMDQAGWDAVFDDMLTLL